MMKKLLIFIAWLAISALSYSQSTNLISSFSFTGNANDDVNNFDALSVNAELVQDRFNIPRSAFRFYQDSLSYISLGDHYDFFSGLDSQFSLSVWFKWADTSKTNILLFSKYGHKICGENQREFFFRINNNKKLEFLYYSTLGVYHFRSVEGSTELNDTLWHHAVISYDGSIDSGNGLDRVSIYLDGKREQTILYKSDGFLGDIQNSTAHFGIGAPLNSFGSVCSEKDKVFEGALDDIKVYSGVLDSIEVKNLFYENICYEIIYDTVNITVIDTQKVPVYDTIEIAVIDTQRIEIYDTVEVAVIDTQIVQVYDTVKVSVTDTLIINVNILGENEEIISGQINIYPNPTKDLLYINIKNQDELYNHYLKIYNDNSQLLYSRRLDTDNIQVDMNIFGAKGLYIIQIVDNNNDIIDTRKIILQ